MFRKIVVLLSVLLYTISINGQNNYESYGYPAQPRYATGYGSDVVTIQLFYEAHCPSCKQFDTSAFKQTVLELAPYLNVQMHPYGNAQTSEDGYGNYQFTSQHGPEETYGDKLHACAIEAFPNVTSAVLFTSCLMDQAGKGSDDAAADACGGYLGVNPEGIKQCAKSPRGSALLKYHGDASKQVGFKHVPTVLVNGSPASTEHFKQDVCKAFRNPPPACYY